jgi:hypothetical protein
MLTSSTCSCCCCCLLLPLRTVAEAVEGAAGYFGNLLVLTKHTQMHSVHV